MSEVPLQRSGSTGVPEVTEGTFSPGTTVGPWEGAPSYQRVCSVHVAWNGPTSGEWNRLASGEPSEPFMAHQRIRERNPGPQPPEAVLLGTHSSAQTPAFLTRSLSLIYSQIHAPRITPLPLQLYNRKTHPVPRAILGAQALPGRRTLGRHVFLHPRHP